MSEKKKIIYSVITIVVIMITAVLLYRHFSPQVETNQLAEKEEEKKSVPAIDFHVYDEAQNPKSLSDYYGKPIVLNFWATWCPNCVEEMDDFQKKAVETGDSVQFLMVNMTASQKETFANAAQYIKDRAYTFPVLYDLDGDAMNQYQVYGLPTSYFIDAEGNIVAYAQGAINAEILQNGIDMANHSK